MIGNERWNIKNDVQQRKTAIWLSRCGNVANFDSNFPLLPLQFRAFSTSCSLLSYTFCETLLRFQKNFCFFGILKTSILVYKFTFPRSPNKPEQVRRSSAIRKRVSRYPLPHVATLLHLPTHRIKRESVYAWLA